MCAIKRISSRPCGEYVSLNFAWKALSVTDYESTHNETVYIWSGTIETAWSFTGNRFDPIQNMHLRLYILSAGPYYDQNNAAA
jgi:hypothetical protein